MSRIVAIRGHPEYSVSDDGYIIGKNGIRMKAIPDKDGYHIVKIYDNGRYTRIRVSRVVAEHFIPNPNNLPQVNHLDGNKDNNTVANLEWSTSSDNTKHSYDIGLHTVTKVVRHNQDGSITKYRNAIIAASENNIGNPRSIRVAISRGTKSGGYHWTRDNICVD